MHFFFRFSGQFIELLAEFRERFLRILRVDYGLHLGFAKRWRHLLEHKIKMLFDRFPLSRIGRLALRQFDESLEPICKIECVHQPSHPSLA